MAQRFFLSLVIIVVALLVGLSLASAASLVAPYNVRANSGVLYAAPDGPTSGSCDSWSNACNLKYALSIAASGDEIWVKQGVHYPGSNRIDTFALKAGVAVYGGFAGSETSREQRDWSANLTILSGDIDINDITDSNGVVTTTMNISGNNAYHVVVGSGELETTMIDGFWITGGQANGAWADPCNQQCGGGVYNVNGSLTLSNITFSGNSAEIEAGWGGGMYNLNSSPNLTGITFSGNSAGGGGGMYNENSNPVMTNVIFDMNSAAYGGGGMVNVFSNPILNGVTFRSNNANGVGGGMANATSSPILTNVAFVGNNAGSGGGMENYYNSNPTLTNVIFSGNNAQGGMGGGMDNWNSNPTLTNVTFSGNKASFYGGGMANYNSSSPTIRNSIFWRNLDSGPSHRPAASIWNFSSVPVITYSLIANCGSSGVGWETECGTDDGNNIANNDVFNTVLIAPPNPADAPTTSGDLHLLSTSPAKDMGNNTFVVGIQTDLDGKTRIINGTVDMGAYEWQEFIFIYLPLVNRATP